LGYFLLVARFPRVIVLDTPVFALSETRCRRLFQAGMPASG
jgi:hypothetical protein